MNALVIVDVPAKQVNKPYTYGIPQRFNSVIEKGVRVIVPFGPRRVLGFVLGFTDDDVESMKDIEEVLDLAPVLNDEMISLAVVLAKQTSSFLITVLKTMIPNSLSIKYSKTLKKINEIESKEIADYFVNDEIDYKDVDEKHYAFLKYEIQKKNIELIYNVESREKIKEETYVRILKYEFLKRDSQREILDYLLDAKEEVKKSDLKDFSESSLKTLLQNGYIEFYKKETYREYKDIITPEKKYIELNLEQEHCYKNIDITKNDTYLLYGVTGSGKTEVYIKLIEDVLARGESALFLVPEISLTPQMAARLRANFNSVAIFHSGMNDNERYDEWRKIYKNEANVVVGARSAIFAPLTNIGIIIIDEEHEASYKQDTNPRYHARDVALMRAKHHNCPLVLGSATPCISSFYKAKNGDYKLLRIPHRANDSVLPNMHIINMSEELSYGNKSMFSNTLKNLISDRLEKKEQVMLLINKRGYSSFVMCRSCGMVVKCPNCDVTLTYHKNDDKLKCHYCGYKTDNVKLCPDCGSTKIKEVGVGTEQVEEQVKKLFNCEVLRMDSDTTTKKNAHAIMIKEFMDNKADVLVGTQMISKGLDFDNVTLVGILMADLTLNIPDYRNSERTFDLIMQVSGRAGRRKTVGDVVIQGYNTNHYAIDSSKYNNYEKFYDIEIEQRKKAKYPPFSYLSQIVIEDSDLTKAFKSGNKIKAQISELLPDAKVIGPATAHIARVNNKFRIQLTIKNDYPNFDLFKIIEDNQDITIYVDHDPILI